MAFSAHFGHEVTVTFRWREELSFSTHFVYSLVTVTSVPELAEGERPNLALLLVLDRARRITKHESRTAAHVC